MNWCAVETVIILLLFLANLTFLPSIPLTLLELRNSLLVRNLFIEYSTLKTN
jgi:hypothetical protein